MDICETCIVRLWDIYRGGIHFRPSPCLKGDSIILQSLSLAIARQLPLHKGAFAGRQRRERSEQVLLGKIGPYKLTSIDTTGFSLLTFFFSKKKVSFLLLTFLFSKEK